MIRIELIAEIDDTEYKQIEEICLLEKIEVKTLHTKGQELTNIIHVIFTDMSPVGFVRDTLISIALNTVFDKLKSIFQERKLKASVVNYDDQISLMGKTFFLAVTCFVHQIIQARKQVLVYLSPHVQGLIPDGSKLIVNLTVSDTKIIVVEPSGNTYHIA